MSQVSIVRAEIKAWERAFKQEHNREPTVQEIKDRPDIAAKYKLYKTLSKTSTASDNTSASGSRPSVTPIGLPKPKARPIKVNAAAITTNPFSPDKRKEKARDPSRFNPFATPTKARAKSRELSPDPFPPIEPLVFSQALPSFSVVQPEPSSLLHTSTSNSKPAVTRARKRLRGEPVSPSPVKEKRPRVISHSTLLLPSRTFRDSDDETEGNAGTDTLLEATPMKALPGGKAFHLLFDEITPRRPRLSSRKDGSHENVLRDKRPKSRALSPESSDDGLTLGPKLKSLSIPPAVFKEQAIQSHQPRAFKRDHTSAVLPSKDDLRANRGPPEQGPSTIPTIQSQSTSAPSKKRALSGHINKEGQSDDDEDSRTKSTDRLPLLPPSPPPVDTKSQRSRLGENGRGASKRKDNAFSRKKAKLLESVSGGDASDDSEDADETTCVNDVTRSRFVAPPKIHTTGDSDPELELLQHPQDDILDAEERPGRYEVNLPEEMQRVLALSPVRTTQEEEHVVTKLLYGRREGNYDAEKGGLIWDVGEDGDVGADEEDWEGEPVPWEVGEL